jgi:hypothetical protein
MMRNAPLVVGVSLALLTGCQPARPARSAQAPGAPSTSAAPPPAARGQGKGGLTPDASIPAEHREAIQRAEEIGRQLFVLDLWGAAGTEKAAEARLLKDDRLVGWLASPEDQGGACHFVRQEGAGYTSIFRVLFPGYTLQNARLDRTEQPMDPVLASAFRARQSALKSGFARMTERYNPVVVPASTLGEEGWLVYLLAATTDPSALVLSGHSRVLVSADGATVKSVTALSKTLLLAPRKATGGDRPAGLFLRHIVTDTPLETHVFTSLVYRMPMVIGTNLGLWVIGDKAPGRIEFKGTPGDDGLTPA